MVSHIFIEKLHSEAHNQDPDANILAILDPSTVQQVPPGRLICQDDLLPEFTFQYTISFRSSVKNIWTSVPFSKFYAENSSRLLDGFFLIRIELWEVMSESVLSKRKNEVSFGS